MSNVSTISPSALLLDRDGVINRELGHFVRDWSEFDFLPGVLTALERLASLPIPVLIVTNQSAVGRGWMAQHTLDAMHERMLSTIRAAGGHIDDVLVCAHAPDAGCVCRKPRPGLLIQAAAKLGFDLSRAWMAGDQARDIEAACAAGAVPVLVGAAPGLAAELASKCVGHPMRVAADLTDLADKLSTEIG
jgi:D-glycero-D-manno-heptose 1,7-bisphosphate phosphatase